MVEIAATVLKEAAKEKAKDAFINEVSKKMTPTELLSGSEKNGISGNSKEVTDIKKEVDNQQEIEEKSDYSKEVNDNIRRPEELEVYQNEGLEETSVNDRIILQDNKIDYDRLDNSEPPMTNLERMKEGLAPLDEKGQPYNLHHIGQNNDSPLAELTNSTHKGEYSTLHDTSITESRIDRNGFNKERAEHWMARAEEIVQKKDTNV